MYIEPILKAIETRIAVVMNAIAIIVVYFLFVIIIVSCHLFEILCFSHCKDRVYFATLQTFSRKIVLDIASRPPNGDNPCHPPSESVAPTSKILKKIVVNIVSAVRVLHPIAVSILSPVRVLHTIAQALCCTSKYSIRSHQALCRPSEYSIQSHQAPCRPSEYSI